MRGHGAPKKQASRPSHIAGRSGFNLDSLKSQAERMTSLHRYQFYDKNLLHLIRDGLHLAGGARFCPWIRGNVHDHFYVLVQGCINGYSQFRVEPGDARKVAFGNGHAHRGWGGIGTGRGFDAPLGLDAGAVAFPVHFPALKGAVEIQGHGAERAHLKAQIGRGPIQNHKG